MIKTMRQYSIPATNLPGALAKVTSALLKEGLGITAVSAEGLGDLACIRLLTDRESNLGKVLEAQGLSVLETPVFCLEIPSKPDWLDKLARALARENVHITHLYGTTLDGVGSVRLVLGVDDNAKAALVLERCL